MFTLQQHETEPDKSVQYITSLSPALLSDIFQRSDWFLLEDLGCHELVAHPRSPLSSSASTFSLLTHHNPEKLNLCVQTNRCSITVLSALMKLMTLIEDASFCCKQPICIIQSHVLTSNQFIFAKTSHLSF